MVRKLGGHSRPVGIMHEELSANTPAQKLMPETWLGVDLPVCPPPPHHPPTRATDRWAPWVGPSRANVHRTAVGSTGRRACGSGQGASRRGAPAPLTHPLLPPPPCNQTSACTASAPTPAAPCWGAREGMEDAAAGAASPAGEDRPAGGGGATAVDPPADGDRDFVLEDGEDMDEGEDVDAAGHEEGVRDGAPVLAPPPGADGEGEGSYGSGGFSPGSPSTADSDLDAEVEMEDDEEDADDDMDDGSGEGEEDPSAGRHGATAAKVPAASRPAAAAGGEPTGGDYPLSDGGDDDGEAVEVRKPRRQRAPIVIPPDLLRRSTRARAEVQRYTITPPTSAEPSSADASDDEFQAAENGKWTRPVSVCWASGSVGVGGCPLYRARTSHDLGSPRCCGRAFDVSSGLW